MSVIASAKLEPSENMDEYRDAVNGLLVDLENFDSSNLQSARFQFGEWSDQLIQLLAAFPV